MKQVANRQSACFDPEDGGAIFPQNVDRFFFQRMTQRYIPEDRSLLKFVNFYVCNGQILSYWPGNHKVHNTFLEIFQNQDINRHVVCFA
jgi:hypothetical protein